MRIYTYSICFNNIYDMKITFYLNKTTDSYGSFALQFAVGTTRWR